MASPSPRTGISLTIPMRVVADMADSPLAIGLYSFIVRLYVCTGEPVPLSEADIARFDPTLKRGAIVRALRRLRAAEWLICSSSTGEKAVYRPTWGRVGATIRLWDRTAPCMGRPRHLFTVRIDTTLFDICLGRLTPHVQQKSHIERYTTSPLLTLADVGRYILARAGRQMVPSVALTRLQLLHVEGTALPVPSPETLLALASQHMLFDTAAPRLTAKGLERMGYVGPTRESQCDLQPLLFVPKDMIGTLIAPPIGTLIGSQGTAETPSSAVVCEESSQPHNQITTTWNEEKQKQQDLPPTDAGGRSSSQRTLGRKTIPDTPATRRLREFNIRSSALIRHAQTPIEQIEAAIKDARSRHYVNNAAGWIIAMLDDAKEHGYTIAPHSTPIVTQAEHSVDHSIDSAPVITPEEVDIYVKSELEWRISDRTLRAFAQRLAFRETERGITVTCPSVADSARMHGQLMSHVRAILAETGRHMAIHVRVGPPPAEHGTMPERPAWIDPEEWRNASPLLRCALCNANLLGHEVQGADAWRDGLLRTRYRAEVAALLARRVSLQS